MEIATKAIAAGLLGMAVSASQAAVLIDFDTDADYDSNFHETFGGTNIRRDAGGYLQQTVTASNISSISIYNANATGGSGGNGGTGSAAPLDKFGGTSSLGAFTIRVDGLWGAKDTQNSVGLILKANDSRTSGYLAVFRLQSGGFDFRVFDSNTNPSTGTVGTQIGSTQTTAAITSLTNTFYRFRVGVEDVGPNVAFTASVWSTSDTLIHSFSTITDTSSALVGAGQVGLRVGTNNTTLRADNFGVTVVPEPASLALLGMAGLGLSRRRR